jgi:general secretion pathway protein K
MRIASGFPARRARGAALILVLWLIALLSALVGTFAMTARIEHLQARVLDRGLVARQAARAGLEYALLRVSDTDDRTRWLADGRAYAWSYGGATLTVRVRDEQGKVDLNQADPTLIAALLTRLGVDADAATRLANAIVDWRDPDSLTQAAGGAEDSDYAAAGLPYGAKDAPFDTVAEVEQVLGMTPAVYARVAPLLTVYSGNARPTPAAAPVEVLDALGYDGAAAVAAREAWQPGQGQAPPLLPDGTPLAGSGSGTYSIDSHARLADGRSADLTAVVRVGGSGLPGAAYTPLSWGEGTVPR